MCILLQGIINPRDFVKYISGKMSLCKTELIAQKLLSRGKIKYFRVHLFPMFSYHDETLKLVFLILLERAFGRSSNWECNIEKHCSNGFSFFNPMGTKNFNFSPKGLQSHRACVVEYPTLLF